MTLSKTWQECLRMWKWIAKVWKPGDNIGDLKIKWLREHGYKPGSNDGYTNGTLSHNCFFCEYDRIRKGLCRSCPVRQIQYRGKWHCASDAHSYNKKPKAFYCNLESLNKKRLEKR